MENKYIDLVLCQHNQGGEKYLFVAPAWSRCEKGDDVVVATRYGEQTARVCGSVTLTEESDYFGFIIEALGVKLPLQRVLKKISYSELDYEKENENE